MNITGDGKLRRLRKSVKYLLCSMSMAVGGTVVADSATPILLSVEQMDGITAGAIFVTADAFAGAEGLSGLTYTSTTTNTRSGKYSEVGYGIGIAQACCGEQTSAAVDLNVGGDGPLVAGFSRSITIRTPRTVFAFGYALVISLNQPELPTVSLPEVSLPPITPTLFSR